MQHPIGYASRYSIKVYQPECIIELEWICLAAYSRVVGPTGVQAYSFNFPS